MPPTNPNCTKSESHDDICSKNYYNIIDEVGIQKLLLDNSKGFINNYDIGRVGDKITWTKKMPSTNPNQSENETHNNDYDSNHNSDKVGDKEQELDDLEDP